VAEQAGVTPQGAGRLRLGSHVAALVLGGLVLVLAVAAVPLARLAHMSLNAATASVPVWVTAPGAVGGFVVAWRKPGNPLGWIFLALNAFSMLTEDAAYYAVADYRLHQGGLPLGWVALLVQPSGLLGLVLLGLIFLLFPDGHRLGGGGRCYGSMPVSAWCGWPGPPRSRWARSSATIRRWIPTGSYSC